MTLHDHKDAYEQARRDYITAVKDAVRSALDAAFERPDVKNVIFGVSTQPYNDENAGTGTYGPLVNAFEGEFDRDKAYNLDALRTQMREKAKQVVKEGTQSIFEQYGDILHSFGWTQYTPYFNDGDPCVFSMGELALIAKVDLEGKDPDEIEDYEDEWVYEGSPAFSPWGSDEDSRVTSTYGEGREGDSRYDACRAACIQVYKALDNATAEDIFGDHVRVVFTADGVEVEEYEHD